MSSSAETQPSLSPAKLLAERARSRLKEGYGGVALLGMLVASPVSVIVYSFYSL